MTDNTDAASTAVAPELKSTDTRLHVADLPTKNEQVKPSPQGEVKAEVVKTPVVAETQDVALEGAETDASNAASPDKGKEQRLPRWMKERLERVRQVTEAETRAAVLKEVQTVPPVAQKTDAGIPASTQEQPKTLADFDFDQDAYFDYKVESKLKERETAAQRESEAKEQAKAAETFKARVDAFEEKVGAGAWEDITTSPLNTDPALKPLVDMILGEEHDLEIAHHLASNPDELTRIAGLTPLARARELAKLADSFGDPAPTANAPVVPPKKTTNAPPPPKTVSGAGKGAIDVNSPTISSADRIAAWRAGRK